eukprot:118093-Chlamydomonas_euryale.AAC.3
MSKAWLQSHACPAVAVMDVDIDRVRDADEVQDGGRVRDADEVQDGDRAEHRRGEGASPNNNPGKTQHCKEKVCGVSPTNNPGKNAAPQGKNAWCVPTARDVTTTAGEKMCGMTPTQKIPSLLRASTHPPPASRLYPTQ